MQAAANAKENLNLSKLNLYVSECYADAGPNLKRFTNGYKGRCALLASTAPAVPSAVLPAFEELLLLQCAIHVAMDCVQGLQDPQAGLACDHQGQGEGEGQEDDVLNREHAVLRPA